MLEPRVVIEDYVFDFGDRGRFVLPSDFSACVSCILVNKPFGVTSSMTKRLHIPKEGLQPELHVEVLTTQRVRRYRSAAQELLPYSPRETFTKKLSNGCREIRNRIGGQYTAYRRRAEGSKLVFVTGPNREILEILDLHIGTVMHHQWSVISVKDSC
jgi:hypothetical protein